MNFLLNAIDGQNDDFGGEGGWGSEEDIDLSDDGEYDEETMEAATHQQQQQQQQQQHAPPPPPPPQASSNDVMRMGGGMFMGRLTQFLDTVAPPQQVEDKGFSKGDGWADDDVDVDVDADAGGWADDDDGLDNLDDATEEAPNDTSVLTNQAVVVPTFVPPPPPPPPAIPDPSTSFGGMSLSSSAAVGNASTIGMNMNKTFDTDNENNDDSNINDEAGWDEDDGLLFGDEDNSDVVNVENDIEADITFETTAPTLSQKALPPPPPPINANDGGWDDDGLLFDDEDDAQNVPEVHDIVETTITAGEKAAESLQPPPPPPPPAIAMNDSNSGERTGWDDDDDDLVFDDEDGEDGNGADVSVQREALPQWKLPDPSLSCGGESVPTNDAVGISDESGWADDDLLEDRTVEAGVVAKKEIASPQLVHSIPPPPPPPPPVQTALSGDDGLVDALNNDDGWGDDDDLGINMSEDFDGDSTGKNVVDHIPSPVPPRMFGDPSTFDNISQDDTLSIANSRSYQNAMSVGIRTISNSSIGEEDFESATEVSTTEAEVESKQHSETSNVRTVSTFGTGGGRLGSKRVVDFTPRRTRISGDDSMMVSGHTSVGESLDSIDEANEEDYEDELDVDNAQNLRRLSGVIIPDSEENTETVTTPRTMESGWGALRQQTENQSSLTKVEQTSSEVPFGSALTPTAANNNPPGRFATLNEAESPMVDHTPETNDESNVGIRGRPSMATSIDVLGSFSDGDLGETDTVGVDNIQDELYGPMVDQIPPTPRDDSPTRRLRKLSSELASIDSTVVGQAENTDIQKDIRDDDAMDEEEEGGEDGADESSRGWGSTLEFDNRSLLSGLPLPVVDETQYLVDHVPVDKLLRGGAASTMVMMDASMASSRAEDNVDGSNNINFGPIVDHTPSLGPSRGAPSIATSVATAVSGLDGDIKEDDDMDNTSVAGGTVDSVDQREDEDLGKVEDLGTVEDDHIVDHIPEGKVRPVNPDASVRVLLGKEDDMTQVDTIAQDVVTEFGPIVDQTPLPFSRNTSGDLSVEASFEAQHSAADDNNTATIGTYTEADDNSGWDHEEPDLDDLSTGGQVVTLTGTTKEENNLVDHIPSRSFAKPVDGSTIVLVDPVDAASEVDDADDDTAGNARVDKFGPVVDHTPAPRSAPLSLSTSMVNQINDGTASDNRPDTDIDGSVTWFGASTLGGMSSAMGDGDSGTGWVEDDLGDLASPVVPRPVQTPVNDHLVDHIPSLASPRHVDANLSTAVTVDQSVVSNQTQDDKMGGGLFGAVVDHTPSVDPIALLSSDNSTVVTGFATNTKRDEEMDETTWQGGVSAQGEGWDQDDPELEDLANNAGDASPHLVDHVPERPESRYGDPSLMVAANPSDMSSQVEDLNQDENHFGPVVDQTPLEHVLPPPAVGSTVVALPSILNDVSDEGDNDGSNADGARVPNEWEEQIPNPQSGIDADVTREQLVDAVPPPPPPEQPMVRDASSEMATVDDKSTLAPADEPKEDEFGPVVDHTPMGEPIEGHNGDACTHEDADGDKKPAATMDSIAPIFSVESKEKEDGLDEDEFGPVVDQLPASSSKSSLAPSKGGSTVDALATVSEGEDDLNTRDGWDDDTLDLIDQASPTNMSHRGNHSVTWDDNVFNTKEVDSQMVDTSRQSNDAVDSTFFTAAESNISSQSGLDETKFYDPEESTDENGWADDSLNIADDDTPPSTPRASAIFKKKLMPDSVTADTMGYQKFPTFLETNEKNESKTNESDLRKLLEEEMAKSLLLQTESDALRKIVDSLKKAKEQLLAAVKQNVGREEELINAIFKWQEANEDLSSENCKISGHVSKIQNESKKMSENVSKFQSENEKLSSENGKLVRDFSKVQNENSELSSENGRLSSHNRKLTGDVLKIEVQCTDLRGKNDLLSTELESLRNSISQLEDEKSEIVAKEAVNSAEIVNLKTSLEKQLQNATSDASLREDIRSAQTELSAKVNECSQMSSNLILIEEKLRKSDAQNFKHTKDLGRMTKDHMQKISTLQQQIDSHQNDVEKMKLVNQQAIADLEQRLSSGATVNQKLKQENGILLQQNNDLQLQLRNAESGNQHELSQKDADIHSLDTQLKVAQENNVSLTDQVNNYAQQLETFTSVTAEHAFITKERDVLKEELVDCKAYVASMQQQFQDLSSSLGLNCTKPESLVKAIQEDRTKITKEIESSRSQISDLTVRLDGIESEKNSIQAQFEEYRKSHESSQNTSAVLTLNAIKEDAKLKKIQGEVDQLRSQLRNSKKDLQNSESERARLSTRVTELEAEVAGIGDITAENYRLKVDISQVQMENKSQGQRISILESNILDNKKVLSSKEREIASLREQLNGIQSDQQGIEHEKQQLVVRLDEMNTRIMELESERDAFAIETNSRIARLGLGREAYAEEMNALVVELGSDLDNIAAENEEKKVQLGVLNEELQGFANEREILFSEKESLEVENEEMLVQFGLLSEEMVVKEIEIANVKEQLRTLEEERESYEKSIQDAKNEGIAYMQQLEDERRMHQEQLQAKDEEKNSKEKELENNLQIAHRRSEEYESQLHMSEEKLNFLISESEEVASSVGDVDDNTKKLIEVNTALRGKIRAMASEQTAAAEQIQAMESHKLGLNGKVDDLQNLVDELIASFESKEGKLQSIIECIKFEKDEIAKKSLTQESDIVQLRQELETSKGAIKECSVLRRNLSDMENKLSDHDRLLLQKDAAAKDLYNRLQNVGNAPVESAEMEMLRDTVRDLEATVSNDKKQLQELGDICDQSQQDLLRTSEQLQVSIETAQQLDNDLQSKRDVESTNQMLELRLDQLEKELMTARNKEKKYRNEASDRKQRYSNDESSKEQNSNYMDELAALRRQVESHEQEKMTSSSAPSAREEAMERELRSLQDQMTQKDNQIASMEDKLRSLDEDLIQSRQQSNEEQVNIDELTADLETMKTLASENSGSEILQDNHMMSTQLVSLAQAFEKSETRRAEILENVESERQAHAERLNKLTFNMRRFYATLKMSHV